VEVANEFRSNQNCFHGQSQRRGAAGDQAKKAENWDNIFEAEAQKPHFIAYVPPQERKRETL
jgi:hypothetical protein